jgi:hypothetical protein
MPQPTRAPRRRKVLISVAIVFIILIAVASYFLFISQQHRLTFRSNELFKGSLVVFTPTPWKVADQSFTGVISYSPTDDEASYLVEPTVPTVIAATPAAFNLDGVHVLATVQATSTQLVSYNRLTQDIDEVIRTISGNGQIASYVWSPDGTEVAYIAIDPDGESGLEVSSDDGITKPGLGTPISFSPDGTQLLVSNRAGVEVIDLATGTHSLISSTAFADGTQLVASPTGRYLLALPAGGEGIAIIYKIDWDAHQFDRVGPLATDAGSLIFTANDELLQIKEDGVAYDYLLSAEGWRLKEVYRIDLPKGAKALFWNKS